MSTKNEKLTYKSMTDEQLVEATCNKQMAAFDELVLRYSRKLFLIIMNQVRSEADSYDIAQKAFLKAFHSLRKLKERDKFFSWLYNIAYNLIRDHFRSHKPMETIDHTNGNNQDDDEGPRAVQPVDETKEADPRRSADRKVIKKETMIAINSLSEKHRVVVMLCTVQGEKPEDVAKLLGIPHATLRTRLFNAHKELREKLAHIKHLMHN